MRVRFPLPAPRAISGGVAERSNAVDCKSTGHAFDGSNPSPTTILISESAHCCGFFLHSFPAFLRECVGKQFRTPLRRSGKTSPTPGAEVKNGVAQQAFTIPTEGAKPPRSFRSDPRVRTITSVIGSPQKTDAFPILYGIHLSSVHVSERMTSLHHKRKTNTANQPVQDIGPTGAPAAARTT